jgi:hypothetical protein
MVALKDCHYLSSAVQNEEVDEAVGATDRKAGLIFKGLFEQQFLSESEEAVDVLHDRQLLQNTQRISHQLAAQLRQFGVAVEHPLEDRLLVGVDEVGGRDSLHAAVNGPRIVLVGNAVGGLGYDGDVLAFPDAS